MSIKKNTLDTITPNKAGQIYRKELAGMSKIWQESSWEWVRRRGGLQLAYKPESKALRSLPPGASLFQQLRKINACLMEIRPEQLRNENPNYFFWPPPSLLHPLKQGSGITLLSHALGFIITLSPRASERCSNAWEGWHHSPKPSEWIWLSEVICLGQNVLRGTDTEGRKRLKGPRGEKQVDCWRWTTGKSLISGCPLPCCETWDKPFEPWSLGLRSSPVKWEQGPGYGKPVATETTPTTLRRKEFITRYKVI